MSKLIHTYESLKQSVDKSLQTVDNFEALASEVLTNVVIQTINTYQQKLNVGIEDSVGDLINTFKQKISQSIFDTVSGWKIANRDKVLFPKGCRFCYTKGQSLIVIIEQDPQIRSLLFDGGMLDESYAPHLSNNAEWVALALPYVVFILHFKNELFVGLYCGWRKSPLRSLDDRMSQPLLPNIHDGLNVCMGRAFLMGRDSGATRMNIAEQTEVVLNNFWNSQFNNDLSRNWWGKSRYDSRLRTARTWADASLEDSSFILNIDLSYLPNRSVNNVLELVTMHEEEPDENALRHKLSEEIDSCIDTLSNRILRYFKKTKFEKFQPKSISNTLAESIKAANHEFIDLVFCIQHELENLKREIDADKMRAKVHKVGPLWTKYSD